jgi:hypothetical protein
VGLGKHLNPVNEGRSSRSRLRDLIRYDPLGGMVAHAVMDVQNGLPSQQGRNNAQAGATPVPNGRPGPHAAGRGAPAGGRAVATRVGAR